MTFTAYSGFFPTLGGGLWLFPGGTFSLCTCQRPSSGKLLASLTLNPHAICPAACAKFVTSLLPFAPSFSPFACPFGKMGEKTYHNQLLRVNCLCDEQGQ